MQSLLKNVVTRWNGRGRHSLLQDWFTSYRRWGLSSKLASLTDVKAGFYLGKSCPSSAFFQRICRIFREAIVFYDARSTSIKDHGPHAPVSDSLYLMIKWIEDRIDGIDDEGPNCDPPPARHSFVCFRTNLDPKRAISINATSYLN